MNKTDGIHNETSKNELTQTNNDSINFVSEIVNEIVENALFAIKKQQDEKSITLDERFEKEENFNEEELKKHSLLESNSIPTISIDNKAFAHISSDPIIKEVYGLEGSNFQETAKTLSDLLTTLSSSSENSEEAKEFEQLAKDIAAIGIESSSQQPTKDGLYESQALEIAKKVFEFESGESCTMPGGWDGFPGHAMLYEFIKKREFWISTLYFKPSQARSLKNSVFIQSCINY
jgi:hypothetical protein